MLRSVTFYHTSPEIWNERGGPLGSTLLAIRDHPVSNLSLQFGCSVSLQSPFRNAMIIPKVMSQLVHYNNLSDNRNVIRLYVL